MIGVGGPVLVMQDTVFFSYGRHPKTNVEAAKKHNGYSSLQRFFRYFPVPGMGHCYGVGSVSGLSGVSPSADPPFLDYTQMFNALVDWVENGRPPDHLTIANASKTLSRPSCAYPKKLKYLGHDMNTVKGYICGDESHGFA